MLRLRADWHGWGPERVQLWQHPRQRSLIRLYRGVTGVSLRFEGDVRARAYL